MLDETYATRPRDWERTSAICTAWRKRDPDGFAAWVATQPAIEQSPSQSNLTFGIHPSLISEIGTDDPEAALQLAEKLNSGAHLKWSIFRNTLKKDPAAALRLAKAHPEIYFQKENLYGSDNPDMDPMLTLPILKSLHPGGGRAELANEGSNYYAEKPDKLAEAAAWFQQLPADAQRHIVVKLEQERTRTYWHRSAVVEENLPNLREIWRLPGE